MYSGLLGHLHQRIPNQQFLANFVQDQTAEIQETRVRGGAHYTFPLPGSCTQCHATSLWHCHMIFRTSWSDMEKKNSCYDLRALMGTNLIFYATPCCSTLQHQKQCLPLTKVPQLPPVHDAAIAMTKCTLMYVYIPSCYHYLSELFVRILTQDAVTLPWSEVKTSQLLTPQVSNLWFFFEL